MEIHMRQLLIIAVLCLGAVTANAHAIIMDSIPATNATVTGPDVAVQLRYNSRIDTRRSVIKLLGPDTQSQTLPISDKSGTDTLVTQITGLAPGAYRLRWQVLSVDGHITRGDIPFTDIAQ
jgi:methionine-rich copper-binding protein CopC